MFTAVNAPVVMRLLVGNDSSTPTKDFPPESASDAAAVALYAYCMLREQT
jgi:hypothetical protein